MNVRVTYWRLCCFQAERYDLVTAYLPASTSTRLLFTTACEDIKALWKVLSPHARVIETYGTPRNSSCRPRALSITFWRIIFNVGDRLDRDTCGYRKFEAV